MTITTNLNEVKESNKYLEVKKISNNIYTVVKIHRVKPQELKYNHGILQ
jgi:hypothetical protein